MKRFLVLLALALAALVMVGCPSSTDGGTDTGTNPGTDTGTDTGTETPQKYRAVKTGSPIYFVARVHNRNILNDTEQWYATLYNWRLEDRGEVISELWGEKPVFPDYVYREQPEDVTVIPPPNGNLFAQNDYLSFIPEDHYFDWADEDGNFISCLYANSHLWNGGWHLVYITYIDPGWDYWDCPLPKPADLGDWKQYNFKMYYLTCDTYEWEPIE